MLETINAHTTQASQRFNQPIAARYSFSIPSENIKKPLGFLIFLRVIEKQNRAVIV